MKLKLDGIVNPELKEFLLTQDGITDVELNYDGDFIELDIKFNDETSPNIIMKYIEMFGKYQFSNLFEFNKDYKGKTKILKYIVDDMCCEYCYRGLVMDLFENNKIKSVKSNFDYTKPAFNIEFTIDYDEDYEEEDLIKYIEEKYK